MGSPNYDGSLIPRPCQTFSSFVALITWRAGVGRFPAIFSRAAADIQLGLSGLNQNTILSLRPWGKGAPAEIFVSPA